MEKSYDEASIVEIRSNELVKNLCLKTKIPKLNKNLSKAKKLNLKNILIIHQFH